MIAEAIDTAYTIGWALLGWLIFFATVAAILTLAAIATGAWGVQALRRGVAASLAAELVAQAPESPPSPRRRTAPSWARTEHDHQEAA